MEGWSKVFIMIKAIIFDCFGILYPEPSGEFFETHRELFRDNSEKLDELNLKIDLGEIDKAEYFQGLEDMTHISAEEIKKSFDGRIYPDPNMVEFIKKLKPTYKVALLSNAGREEIAVLYRDKLDTLFDVVTVSYEIKSVKPDPKIFLVSVERLGVKPEDLYLSTTFRPILPLLKNLG